MVRVLCSVRQLILSHCSCLVLDIGTYSGFSALAWYEGTKKKQAEIVTLELSKEMIAITRSVFEKNQVEDRIKMAEGLASERSGFGKPSSSVNANIS